MTTELEKSGVYDSHDRLAGNRVVVTGATGGIGTALSQALGMAGARLAVTSASADKLDALATTLGEACAVQRAADITSEEQVAAFFAEAATSLGAVDALVNLAGCSEPTVISDADLSSYERMLHVNLTGTLLACKHLLPLVDSSRGALVVNVGSMAAIRANANAPLYCTAKAGVAMFSAAFALQAQESNVRVTTINPGGVDTPFWGERPVDRSKLMTPTDVVEAIVYVLTRPSHVVVRDMSFEATGRG